ncbi:MAG TPA: glycosyltransferase, partial [Leptolinea sp.]
VGSESLLSEIQPGVKIYRTPPGEPSISFLEKEKAFGQRNWLTKIIVKVFGGGRRWMFRNLFLPDRVITWLPFALRQGRKIVKNEGIDVLFATCPPYSVALIGALMKRLTGKPLILDYRDDWIDTPPFQSKPKLIRMIERRMESWTVKTADRVTLVTEWSRQAFLDRYPLEPKDKFIFISNGCDLEEFSGLNSLTAAPKNQKFTIVHTGSLNDSINWTRIPMALFQAVHHILQSQPELTEKLSVNFTGFLPERQKQLVTELGLTGVVNELGFLPRDEWLKCMQEAGMLLVINYDDWSTIIPGKIYEYWAVGGPPILLLSYPGAATDFVERHNLGFAFEPYDVDKIEQTILNIYRQSKTDSPLKIKTDGIEAFDRQALTNQLARVLSTLI